MTPPLSAAEQVALTTPASRLREVSANDAADLPGGIAKALWITGDGDLTVIAADDDHPNTLPVLAGQLFPVRVRRVLEASTATVVALY